jgi:hypothetical protein
MYADPAGVLTGSHFLDGDHACCEGAPAVGARFSAGYPIMPSTEVVERSLRAFPPWVALSSRWRTNLLPPSPSSARFGAAPRPSP